MGMLLDGEKENKGMRFQNHSKPGIHPSLLFSPSNNIPIPPIICQFANKTKEENEHDVIEEMEDRCCGSPGL